MTPPETTTRVVCRYVGWLTNSLQLQNIGPGIVMDGAKYPQQFFGFGFLLVGRLV